MSKIARFVIWICSKFTRLEIEQIITGLLDVLNNRNPEVKPKDDFKEKYPNYRNFFVDPLPPLTTVPTPKFLFSKDYKILLAEYHAAYGKPLTPVKYRPDSPKIPELTTCPCCNAPHAYLYYNDSNKRSQLKCKVCGHLFQLNQRYRKNNNSRFFCPYCHYALFIWKQRPEVTIYKCSNKRCPHRLKATSKLNSSEQSLQKTRSSQFKLCYQYREYHFHPHELIHSSPDQPKVDLAKIHNSHDTLGLVLAFHISFAISARKTAYILKSVFRLNLSYQTVLNYAEAASFYCHRFNLMHKGDVDPISAGDETYIRVQGKHAYVFFFLSSDNHKISAYHVADNQGTLPAITAMKEAIRTASPKQELTLITDGNPY